MPAQVHPPCHLEREGGGAEGAGGGGGGGGMRCREPLRWQMDSRGSGLFRKGEINRL